jgi:sugar lactone lactonase YvrE/pimeloyl-ACP methyl ester carboxylesterase
MAVDASGNVYVADAFNNRIRKVSPAGIITTIAGTENHHYNGDGIPATSATLSSPHAVAVDSLGNVYIADTGHRRIRKIGPTGIITTIAGNGEIGDSGDGGPAVSARFDYPSGVAVDAVGNVYISDSYKGRVRRIAPDGIISAFAGSRTCCDRGDGGLATNAFLSRPTGITVDATGNVFIVDMYGGVRKVTGDGLITTIAGNIYNGYSGDGGLATSARFFWPRDVAVDTLGNIYIADTGNDCIRKVAPDGIITTIAGTGYNGYFGDGGPAANAKFRSPRGVAVDASGNLYIADTYNNRIRKVFVSGASSCMIPSITTQPKRQTVGSEGVPSSHLFVTAAGTWPLTYQWYRGNVGDTSNPVGTNSASYVVPALTLATSYWVRITNACGSVNSALVTVPPLPCGPISVSSGQQVSGVLDSSCLSTRRSGRYFKLYSFTASSGDAIAASMSSTQVDAYLYLLGPTGSVVASNDDGGGGSNSRIQYTAASGGTYTIEATTYGSGSSGSFTLELSAGSGGSVNCTTATISSGQTQNGALTSSCPSARRPGSYAKTYTFPANSGDSITASMSSSQFDSFMYLVGPSGQVVASNDDGGGDSNSRIQHTAASGGTYTIEATTYHRGQVGNFTLALTVAGGGTGGSVCTSSPVASGQNVNGVLNSTCASAHRPSGRFAKLYTFTANSGDAIAVTMNSSDFDPYLFLLGFNGSVVASNDDFAGGRGSRVEYNVVAGGTYTIEASSYHAGSVGNFTLTLTQAPGGALGELPESAHNYPNRYDHTWPYSLPMSTTAISVTFDSRTSVEANFDYIHVMDGDSTEIQGSPFTGRELAGKTMVVPGNKVLIRLTSDESVNEWGFAVTAVATATTRRKMVFLIHGIAQRGGALNGLKTILTQSESKIDNARFEVDDQFDWPCAVEEDGECSNASISSGGLELAKYIAERTSDRPATDIILIGYSMGGLIARDMILNNRGHVLDHRRVAALITLGTPHLGYPYHSIDESVRPDGPSRQMAGDFRNHASALSWPNAEDLDDNAGRWVALSAYLHDLNHRWSSASSQNLPQKWLAVSGRSCDDPVRGRFGIGCPDGDQRYSDGVVCDQSAGFRLKFNNGPTDNWGDPDRLYSHTGGVLTFTVLCGDWPGGMKKTPLFEPAPTDELSKKLQEFIDAVQ